MSEAKCRGCLAPVLFIRNLSGNLMILDAAPVADGNIVLVDGVAHVLKGDLWEQSVPDGPRYKDHHATCPVTDQFRRKKPSKKKQ